MAKWLRKQRKKYNTFLVRYFFVLGNAPQLAKVELESLLDFREIYYLPPVLILETDKTLETDFLERLGGTVKVGEVIQGEIVKYIKNTGEPKIDFGVSVYGTKYSLGLVKEIKRELEKTGIKSRFVLPKKGKSELLSVVVRKQKLMEFLMTKDHLAKTIWVQDFESWGRRDYGRPEVEGHLGMLPPKVARMMVNAGLRGGKSGLHRPACNALRSMAGRLGTDYTDTIPVILDPFGGVGTIAAEALMIGCRVVTGDIRPEQSARAQKNLDWLSEEYGIDRSWYRVKTLEAREVSKNFPEKHFDAVVTEPDLGPSTEGIEHRGESKEKLARLYHAALDDWRKALKPGGKVVIALPSFTMGSKGVDESLVKNVIDKASLMGYSLANKPFPYFRPQAQVRRNITIFHYGTH